MNCWFVFDCVSSGQSSKTYEKIEVWIWRRRWGFVWGATSDVEFVKKIYKRKIVYVNNRSTTRRINDRVCLKCLIITINLCCFLFICLCRITVSDCMIRCYTVLWWGVRVAWVQGRATRVAEERYKNDKAVYREEYGGVFGVVRGYWSKVQFSIDPFFYLRAELKALLAEDSPVEGVADEVLIENTVWDDNVLRCTRLGLRITATRTAFLDILGGYEMCSVRCRDFYWRDS
jgi:hypothetical protein